MIILVKLSEQLEIFPFIDTYVIYSVNKWIVTTIWHGQPVEKKEYIMDIFVSVIIFLCDSFLNFIYIYKTNFLNIA